ncbi:hypothetical protein [Terrabacter terrae]
MPAETFKWSCRSWIRSSEGYAVRLMGRPRLQYSDEYGDLEVSA